MSETPPPKSPETQELSLEDYEKLKKETLLKHGCPEGELPLSKCFTTEYLKSLLGVERAFELYDLENSKYVLYYDDLREACLAQGFDDEKGFEEACGFVGGHFRKEGEEWQEGVSNLEYYKHIKDRTLVKHGFPKSELSKVVCAVTFLADELEDNSEGSVALNYFFNPEHPPIYMPFKTEEEFEEACRQCAECAETLKKLRLADINMIIDELEDKIERVWDHKPQELPGTYEHNGKKYMTRGIKETLSQDEIQLLCAYIHKRLIENDGGIDYLQVMESDDEKVFMIDRLNREMKESGEFRDEDNYSTMMLAEER